MPFVPSMQISRNTTAYGPAAALCKNASPLSTGRRRQDLPTPAAAAVPAAGLQTSGLQRSRSAAPSLRSPLQLDCTTFFHPLHLPFTRETPPFTQNCPICAAKACRKTSHPSGLPSSCRFLHNLYFLFLFSHFLKKGLTARNRHDKITFDFERQSMSESFQSNLPGTAHRG